MARFMSAKEVRVRRFPAVRPGESFALVKEIPDGEWYLSMPPHEDLADSESEWDWIDGIELLEAMDLSRITEE